VNKTELNFAMLDRSMLSYNFIYLGILIYLTGSYAYIRDTIKGKVKPNKVSFSMWSLASFIAFAAAIDEGVGIHALITFIVGAVPFTILIISLFNKKAYWKITRFDLACGVFSIIGLILWRITGDGNIAIGFSILADGFAFIPTMRKAYSHPHTENAYSYFAASIGIVFTLLTIDEWTFATYAFPLYLLLFDLAVSYLVWSKLGFKSKVTKA
jgi:hypothetical protein